MSKTQLQTNNTRLASLIDELKGKAAGGGGSTGGGFNACSLALTIECHKSSVFYIIYTSVDDTGNLVGDYKRFYLGALETETITANVLQGSTVGIISPNCASTEHTLSPGATIISGFYGGIDTIIQAGAETSANWTIIFA